MSYRNPRFSILHAALEAGAGSVAIPAGGGTADTSIERLRDGRTRALFQATHNLGAVAVEFTRPTDAIAHQAIDRLLIPAGHNLRDETLLPEIKAGSAAPGTLWNQADGVGADVTHVPAGLYDLELEPCPEAFLRASIWEGISSQIELGELWFTRTLQATTGVDPQFNPGTPQRQQARSESLAGVSYVSEKGPPRRLFEFDHNGVSGADLALYERIVEQSRASGGLLWYEHPDSADVETLLDGMGDTAPWAPTAATLGLVTGYNSVANGAIQITSTSAADAEMATTLSTPMDLRNRVLWLDLQIADVAWVGAGDIAVRVISGAGFSREYDLAGFFTSKGLFLTVTGKYYRCPIDFDLDTSTAGANGPADLSAITSIEIVAKAGGASETLDVDNLRLIDKSKQPVLCEVTEFDWVQDARAPSSMAGPSFKVSMGLLEFTG